MGLHLSPLSPQAGGTGRVAHHQQFASRPRCASFKTKQGTLLGIAGRKRKPGSRYPSGQLKRPTYEQLQEADRAQRLVETAVVLNQPHRKGSPDVRCASALGRFAMAFRLDPAVTDGAEYYARQLSRWRAAKGVPRTVRSGEGRGDHDPAPQTVQGWAAEIGKLELAMVRVSHAGFLAARRLILDDEDIPAQFWLETRSVLIELARETGHLERNKQAFIS